MFRRFAGLITLSVASMAAPLLYVPVLARVGTGADFAAFGIGGSVGALAGVFVNGGWSLTGEARSAATSSDIERDVHLRLFLVGAAKRYIVVAPLACAIAVILSGQSVALAAFSAAAMASSGMSTRWHFVGSSNLAGVLRWETLPHLIAAFCGAGGLVAGVLPLGVALLVQPIVVLACVAGISWHLSRSVPDQLTIQPAVPKPSMQFTAVGTQLTSALYGSGLPSLLAAVAGPEQVVPFYVFSRMLNLATIAVVALSSTFISWTARSPSSRKYAISLLAHVVTGALIAGAILAGGQRLSALLFSDEHVMSAQTTALLALCLFIIHVATWTGRIVLVPLRAIRPVLHSTLVGACVGIGATLVLAPAHGYTAAVAATVAAQAIVLLMQSAAVPRALRPHRSS